MIETGIIVVLSSNIADTQKGARNHCPSFHAPPTDTTDLCSSRANFYTTNSFHRRRRIQRGLAIHAPPLPLPPAELRPPHASEAESLHKPCGEVDRAKRRTPGRASTISSYPLSPNYAETRRKPKTKPKQKNALRRHTAVPRPAQDAQLHITRTDGAAVQPPNHRHPTTATAATHAAAQDIYEVCLCAVSKFCYFVIFRFSLPRVSPRTPHLIGRQAASAVPESVGGDDLEAVDQAVRQALHGRVYERLQPLVVDVHRGHGLDVDVGVGRGRDDDVLRQRASSVVRRCRPRHRRLRYEKKKKRMPRIYKYARLYIPGICMVRRTMKK